MGSTDESRKIRIAVVGVGMAGVAAGLNLLELPDAEVQLYERSVEHRLAGAWLGVTPSAQRTLSKWCTEKQLDKVIHYRYNSFSAMDWQTGEFLYRPEQRDPSKLTKDEKWKLMDMSNVVRSDLHRLTLELLPKRLVQTGKKALSIENLDEGIKIKFEDGSETIADVLIASDGINSKIRKFLYPDIAVKYLGNMAYTGFWDRDELKAAIPELPDDDLVLCHKGCLIFMGYVGPTQYAIEAILPENSPDSLDVRWDDTASTSQIDFLISYFKDWTPIVRKFFEFAKEKNMKLAILPRYRSPWLHKLTAFDRLAFIGDAAHPTAGAFGSGTSFAYEDARTVFLSLQHAYKLNGSKWNPEVVKTGLEIYNEIRSNHYRAIEPRALDHERMWTAELQDMSTEFSAVDFSWITDHDADRAFDDWTKCHTDLAIQEKL